MRRTQPITIGQNFNHPRPHMVNNRITYKSFFDSDFFKTFYQEDDHHEAVKDGEPVDPVLEEVWIQILVKSILKYYQNMNRW